MNDERLMADVESCLLKLLDSGILNESEEKMLIMRYGLRGSAVAKFDEMAKLLNRNPKLLKKDIESLDKKVFNYAKAMME